jgi:hypothetical protein
MARAVAEVACAMAFSVPINSNVKSKNLFIE